MDQKTLENIERYGCHVIHVLPTVEEVDEVTPFSYSVGIYQSTSAPELLVIGLKHPLAHNIINEYNQRVRKKESLLSGHFYSGFIEGFDVLLEEIPTDAFERYFGGNLRLYKGSNFKALQLIYPNTQGVWPWEPQANEWFRKWQPILSGRTPTFAG